MTTRAGMSTPMAGLAAAPCLALIGALALIEPAADAALVVYAGAVACSAALLFLAVRGMPVRLRRPWYFLLTMQVLALAGEIYSAVRVFRGTEVWSLPVDLLYTGSYLMTACGVIALDRQRNHRPPFGGMLDAAVVTAAAVVLSLVFVLLPLLTDTSASITARLAGSVYPIVDVLLVFLVARLLIASPNRSAVVYWVVAGITCSLTADVALNVMALGGNYAFPRWMSMAWAAFFLLVACGAVSAGREGDVSRAPAVHGVGLTIPRLTVLAFSASLPLAVLIARAANGEYRGAVLLGIGSLLLLVMVVVRIWTLLQQLRHQSDQMSRMARTDPLTGVANRRSWDFELGRAMALTRSSGAVLLVALLDLDHFKKYNDAFGHQAGDDLLREAARAWSLGVGPDGRIARWGGEEFAVALRCPGVEAGLHTLDELRRLVPFGQTCSIGVARWNGTQDPDELLRTVDVALYEAKDSGRNRTVLAPVDVVSRN